MPPYPLVVALVLLKCHSNKYTCPHRVPFTKEEMPLVPLPVKKRSMHHPGLHESGWKKLNSDQDFLRSD